MTEKMTATDAAFVARLLSYWEKADPTDPAAASVARVVEHLHEQIRQLTSQADCPRGSGIAGLTVLDYFAAAALQGLLAAEPQSPLAAAPQSLLAAAPQRNTWDRIGTDAYRYAKAALRARQLQEMQP